MISWTTQRLVKRVPLGLRLRVAETLARGGIQPGRPSMYGSLVRLRRLGHQPGTIFDVGACHGDWTRMARSVWPEARVVMFEARMSEKAALDRLVHQARGAVKHRIVLLGAEQQERVPFFELEHGGSGSSVLQEVSAVGRKTLSLPMHRLDDEVEQLNMNVDLLKLDVQGGELEVLRGGEATLGKAEVVILEVSLMEYNRGAPLAAEVMEYLRDKGFVLFDIASEMRDPSGRLFQSDMVFARRGSRLRV